MSTMVSGMTVMRFVRTPSIIKSIKSNASFIQKVRNKKQDCLVTGLERPLWPVRGNPDFKKSTESL